METSSKKTSFVLFVDLRNELNSLTFEFLFVNCRYIQQYKLKKIEGDIFDQN